jgi:hypothetical protein
MDANAEARDPCDVTTRAFWRRMLLVTLLFTLTLRRLRRTLSDLA